MNITIKTVRTLMIKALTRSLKNTPASLKIITAMMVGLLIGATTSTVFIGVNEIANAFIMLLQMTALPYISLSLITGIGGLSSAKISSTVKKSLIILLSLIALLLFFILLAPIAFPNWQSADFYSVNTIKTVAEFDLIQLFIPTNPFYSFANGLIPSVVMFSIFLGVGLMQVKAKKQTLLTLIGLNNAIINVSFMVMKLAPLAIFCIALRAAATIDASQLDGLLVYIVTAAVLVFLLALVILPAIVATITPFEYKDILKATRSAMITAFATGSFFIVIPLIVEKTKQLIDKMNTSNANEKSNALIAPSIIVPISFSLPVGGKLLALLFVLFAAWFSGSPVGIGNYLQLLTVGLPQLFGSTSVAMPSLLALFNVPSALFELFLVAENLIVGRLGALLSVIFSASLVILIATSIVKQFTFKWRSFSKYLIILPAISMIAFISLRFTFDSISHQYQGYKKFIERDFVMLDIDSTVLKKPENVEINSQPDVDVLTRIKQRGFIRVGYFRDDLPYTFHNHEGKLVGLDIEIINLLANDLGVSIEFVLIFHQQAQKLLSSGYLDMTTGVPVLPNNMKEFTLTVPYSSQSIAFIVKDERRSEFTDWKTIFNNEELIISIPELYYNENLIKRYFKHNKVWEISTPRLYFKEKYQHIDAMLFGAPTASAWTLLHPEYTVVAPKPAQPPLAMAFAINSEDKAFELFMRSWIQMKIQNKDIARLFDYWIAGKPPHLLSKQL
ncbi:MAG: cation:dicarboxylase symporter family transporter [Colwellia sp.]|nr:cation:dicarboxylase symporter family transporter [Colwellia sp.]